MRKRWVVGRIYGMKYSWKGHKDRNRHKTRIKNKKYKKSEQARLVYVKDINCCNIPTTWRWARRVPRRKRGRKRTSTVKRQKQTTYLCVNLSALPLPSGSATLRYKTWAVQSFNLKSVTRATSCPLDLYLEHCTSGRFHPRPGHERRWSL